MERIEIYAKFVHVPENWKGVRLCKVYDKTFSAIEIEYLNDFIIEQLEKFWKQTFSSLRLEWYAEDGTTTKYTGYPVNAVSPWVEIYVKYTESEE